jgi:hypothetical protein
MEKHPTALMIQEKEALAQKVSTLMVSFTTSKVLFAYVLPIPTFRHKLQKF